MLNHSCVVQVIRLRAHKCSCSSQVQHARARMRTLLTHDQYNGPQKRRGAAVYNQRCEAPQPLQHKSPSSLVLLFDTSAYACAYSIVSRRPSMSAEVNNNGRCVCAECGVVVAVPQLAAHMRRHLGYRPYACSRCAYAAYTEADVQDHARR